MHIDAYLHHKHKYAGISIHGGGGGGESPPRKITVHTHRFTPVICILHVFELGLG